MELIALGAPWVLLLLIVAAFGLLIFKRWKVAIGLLLVTLAGNWYFQVMPVGVVHWVSSSWFHVSSGSKFQVSGGELKVMTFNCNLSPKHEDYLKTRTGVCRLIKEQNPDVVFLAENFINTKDSVWLMLQDVYPYHSQEKKAMGNSIYSKYPILTDTIVREKGKGYGINCCLIDCCGHEVGVIGVHLSSNNYNEHMEYMTPDSVASSDQARSYLGQIRSASRQREEEAKKAVEAMKELWLVTGSTSTGSAQAQEFLGSDGFMDPVIAMGDFNDVWGSPTLNVLKRAGLKDAWWEGGTGYGATIHHPLPYRIDHIMHSDGLQLMGVKVISTDLSDHNPVVARFKIIGK